jgi:hypothetical protein
MKAQPRTRAPGAIALAALVAVLLAACSSLLDVTDPDVINPGDVGNADGAVAAYNGAIGNFAFANDGDNGGTEGQVLVSGTMADEYFDSETFPTRIEYDSRAINLSNTTLSAVYFNLHHARVSLQQAAAALEQYAPAPDSRVGEMLALAGMTYVYFAENYCSGAPFSERLPDGSIQYGMPLTTDQMLDTAIARFDAATAATATAHIVNLAAVGRGRALLDQGNFAAAATAVAGVPTGFTYAIPHSTSTGRQYNGIFVFNNQAPDGTGRFSVADTEGTNGLNFRSAGDPRVVAPQHGLGFDKISPLYVLQKYTGPTDSTHVADGLEARLIEAEAQLQGGAGAAMVTSLNALRADNTNNGGFTLPALADPGTQVGREDLLFRERAFWMFGTGHRLGDLRRLVRQYGRVANSVYPTGDYLHANTVFGTNTELPVPFDEQNNPNYTSCDFNTP